MRKNYKIIIAGPVGSGKTTAIHTISDSETIRSDNLPVKPKQNNENKEVSLDYGSILLKDGTKIHLHGTPGQKRLDYMWKILSTGGSGLILLIDGSDKKALSNMEYFLKSFRNFIEETSVIIGITKQDKKRQFSLENFNNMTANLYPIIPIFEIDPRDRKDVALIVETLLYTLDTKHSI